MYVYATTHRCSKSNPVLFCFGDASLEVIQFIYLLFHTDTILVIDFVSAQNEIILGQSESFH